MGKDRAVTGEEDTTSIDDRANHKTWTHTHTRRETTATQPPLICVRADGRTPPILSKDKTQNHDRTPSRGKMNLLQLHFTRRIEERTRCWTSVASKSYRYHISKSLKTDLEEIYIQKNRLIFPANPRKLVGTSKESSNDGSITPGADLDSHRWCKIKSYSLTDI